ncbi:MAG: hypothetical protein ACR65U_14600 [Methylocystis sp.]
MANTTTHAAVVALVSIQLALLAAGHAAAEEGKAATAQAVPNSYPPTVRYDVPVNDRISISGTVQGRLPEPSNPRIEGGTVGVTIRTP